MKVEKSKSMLRDLNEIWTNIQSQLQAAWKFNVDSKYVRFWEVPQCTCPKMDNEERYGYGAFIKRIDCPVHGDNV